MLVYQRVYIYNYIYTGWWLTYLSEKYEFVSWDDEIPNIWKNKIHVPNQQPVYVCFPYIPMILHKILILIQRVIFHVRFHFQIQMQSCVIIRQQIIIGNSVKKKLICCLLYII